MTSLGFVSEDVLVPVTMKESAVVQVGQLTELSPMAEPQEMESLGATLSANPEISEVEESQDNNTSVLPSKERRTNEANVRRSRTSPSPRLHRSTSMGFLKQGREGNGGLPRRRDIGLRLPSFRGLGISSSEPKYLSLSRHTEGQHSRLEVPSRPQRPGLRPRPSSIYHHASEPHFGSTPLLTPPEDTSSIKWNNAILHPASSNTPQCRQNGTNGGHMSIMNTLSTGDHSSRSSITLADQPQLSEGTGNMSTTTGQGALGNSSNNQTWLDEAIEETVSSTGLSPAQNSTLNVVAHVLPLPAEDSSPHHVVFTRTIQAIQDKHAQPSQPYITITHAVPHKFDLNSLPASPPVTPNLVQGNGDYFNQYTFAHAAVVPAYHVPTRGLSTSTSSSPNPIVPPRSVQVAILERYIPPSSIQEYNDLFSIHGRSALLDRLSELSIDGGTLLFIFPTKAGATMFSDSYLSPVLTPILLQIVNLNRLVWNLAEDIGRMPVIPIMNEFDIMKAKLTTLCRAINERPSIGSDSQFELVHSSIGSVPLDQATWREWYIEQEQGRVREVLRSYWKQGRRLPGDTEVTDATIARAVIDGLRKGVKGARPASGERVEVGVFVVKRSPASS